MKLPFLCVLNLSAYHRASPGQGPNSMMLPSRFVTRQLAIGARRWNHTALNPVTEQDIDHFANFLAPTSILSTLGSNSIPVSELSPYNDDWMGKYHGKATTVVKPKTTEEVSKVVKHCWERRIGIVPQGGNTGLVGGSVPIRNELVLNLGNMSKVRSFDPVSGPCRLYLYRAKGNSIWCSQEYW